MNLRKLACVMAIVAALLPSAARTGAAIEEEVGAPAPEIFHAAMAALTPYGIHKKDEEKFYLESKYIEDRVERREKHFFFKNRRDYDRRYRVKITLTPWPRYAVVKVEVDPRYRSPDGNIAAPWRKLKEGRDGYELEREFFRRILAQLEASRSAANP